MSLSNSIEIEEQDTSQRWMVSYADLMTVLFCLAIALLVVSKKQISETKPILVPSQSADVSAIANSSFMESAAQSKGLTEAAKNTNIKVLTFNEGSLIIIPEQLIFRSADATVKNPEQLAELFQYLGSLNKKLIVAGHTDNIPIASAKFASNWELSSARASAVARLLQENGVAPYLLKVEGKSDIEPVASNASEQGRQKNRRVSIFVSTS